MNALDSELVMRMACLPSSTALRWVAFNNDIKVSCFSAPARLAEPSPTDSVALPWAGFKGFNSAG